MADHLSFDLLTNIFSRPSVKQLCQLKCLSKEWLHTISSLHFKKQHRDESKKRPTLSLITSSRSDTLFRSQLLHLSSINSSNYDLVQEYGSIAQIEPGYNVCSSGLDLLSFYQTGYAGKIWICNPITKKTLALPILSHFAGRACLGYVSTTNEYKILVSFERTVEDSDDWEFYAGFEKILYFKILTLKLNEEKSVVGSWRDLSLSCTRYSGTCGQPIHINGFIYWLAFAKDNTFSSDHVRILEINLENEEIKTICCPSGYSFRFSHLADINGHLCMVQNEINGHLLNIWMLKSGKWCLEYSVEVHESAYNYTIVGYLPRNSESSGDILIRSFEGDLFCYETDTKKLKELRGLSTAKYKWCALYYYSFFPIGMPGH